MRYVAGFGLAALCLAAPVPSVAQSAANLNALRGLAPFSRLPASPEGKAALDANLKVTGDIQSGAAHQPLLLPLPEQRLQALKDCFITDGNATQLADGLGSRIGGAYQAKARYADHKTFTSVSPALARLIGYTNTVTKSDSNAGKYFFANGTVDGKKPVSEEAAVILAKGTTDVFGKAYGRPAGSPGSDSFGDARPFQTLPALTAYRGEDYFGTPSHSLDWLRGPNQDLLNSPAFPSGHTTYGTTESMILAILVPARYQQMVTRAAEYGNDRIVVGAHYAMDVIGGRTTSLHALAHLLANDPAYVGQIRTNPAVLDQASADTSKTVTLADYPAVVKDARAEIEAFVAQTCGRDVAACAGEDTSRFRDPAANAARRPSRYGREDRGRRRPRPRGLASPDRGLPRTVPGRGQPDPHRDPGARRRLPRRRIGIRRLFPARPICGGRAASLAASRRAGGAPSR